MTVDLFIVSKTKYDLHRPWLNSVFNYIDQEGVILYDREHPERARPDAVYAGRGDESTLQYPLPDYIFGFRTQQSWEKLMKALISSHNGGYPFPHDLEDLLKILEDCGEAMPLLPF
jgi:hypothetical protein